MGESERRSNTHRANGSEWKSGLNSKGEKRLPPALQACRGEREAASHNGGRASCLVKKEEAKKRQRSVYTEEGSRRREGGSWRLLQLSSERKGKMDGKKVAKEDETGMRKSCAPYPVTHVADTWDARGMRKEATLAGDRQGAREGERERKESGAGTSLRSSTVLHGF